MWILNLSMTRFDVKYWSGKLSKVTKEMEIKFNSTMVNVYHNLHDTVGHGNQGPDMFK